MGMFVHLTSEDSAKRIARVGVRGQTIWTIDPDHNRLAVDVGVYCLPVVPNFYTTHQWVRELKRTGKRTIVGVYFRIPRDVRVWVGKYNQPHELVGAGTAAARVMRAESPEGMEVILPRSVSAPEIHQIRELPQLLGWRYFPGSHQRGIFCRCESCNAGGIKARRIILADESTRNRLSIVAAEELRRSGEPEVSSGAIAKKLKAAKRRRNGRKSDTG